MSSKRCYIKRRRENGMVVSEAYAYGNSWKDEADHGDAVGITWKAIYSGSSSIPARTVRKNLMIRLCNQGIIPVTQLDGLVLCFPDGEGGIELIEDCA